MIRGHVRDRLPRLTLKLPGRDGGRLTVEFIVDTGFDGDLAMSSELIRQLDVRFFQNRTVLLADGGTRERSHYRMALQWNNEERIVEVIEVSKNPLLGMGLLENFSL